MVKFLRWNIPYLQVNSTVLNRAASFKSFTNRFAMFFPLGHKKTSFTSLHEHLFRLGFLRSKTGRSNLLLCCNRAWGQFHQHFTSSLCVCSSQKRKKTLMSSIFLKLLGSLHVNAVHEYVGEIGPMCQFHQHFTRSFFIWKCFSQLFSTYCWAW